MKDQLGIALVAVLAVGAGAAVDAGVANEPTAQAELKDIHGKSLGTLRLEQAAQGLIIQGSLHGVPPGTHALHIHQVGKCEPPFKSAGDHFNPLSKQHGLRSEGGEHAGDLPNLVAPANGDVSVEVFAPGVTLTGGKEAVLDADGAAVVLHAKADDYASQPAGNAGDRVACGIIVKH
jgi:Cu-Zn family superoxide dismutase